VFRRLFRLIVAAGVVGGVVVLVRKILAAGTADAAATPVGVPPLPREQWPPLQPDRGPTDRHGANGAEPDPDAPRAAPAPTTTAATDPQPTEAVSGPDPDTAWVDPVDGTCPATHPVKAKLASKIFHVPGGLSYERTKPDRCYRDAAAAEADGLRAAKR
jgi:hypothetical protein